MPGKTNNIYGKITISDKTIERFVHQVALDCYGMVAFASKNFWELLLGFFKKGSVERGVKVRTVGDRIYIDVSVILKYGVSIKAVVEALKESVKYKVERFTGMLVNAIDVNVKGIKD